MSISPTPRISEGDSSDLDRGPLGNFTTLLLENELLFLRHQIVAVIAGSLLSKVAVVYENKDSATFWEDSAAFWKVADAYGSQELVEPLGPLNPLALARIRELEESISIVESELDFRGSSH